MSEISEMLNVSDVSDGNAYDDVVNVSNVSDANNITENNAETEQSCEPTPSVEELTEALSALRAELDGYKAAAAQQEAIANQLNEFYELFPSISVKAIPDEVWNDVKSGNTLAAAYSLYEKRITEAARRIERINAHNAAKSAGVAGKNLADEFFSAEDVRKMSPKEVRANYAKIRRSMEKWN